MGWLVFDRPDAGNAMNATMLEELESAWLELDGDPAVRGDREHRRRPRLPDRPGHRPAESGARGDAGAVTPDQACGASLDGVAQRGDQAGRRGRQRGVRRRWAALRGRRRRGRRCVEAAFLDPHVSVGQVTAYEAITLVRKSPMEPIVSMALAGRHERMTAARAHQLGHPERGGRRRRSDCPSGPRSSPRPSHATRRRPWRRPSAPCGGRSRPGSPTPAGPAARS